MDSRYKKFYSAEIVELEMCIEQKLFICRNDEKFSWISSILGALNLSGVKLDRQQLQRFLDGRKVRLQHPSLSYSGKQRRWSVQECSIIRNTIAAYRKLDEWDFSSMKDFLTVYEILRQDVVEENCLSKEPIAEVLLWKNREVQNDICSCLIVFCTILQCEHSNIGKRLACLWLNGMLRKFDSRFSAISMEQAWVDAIESKEAEVFANILDDIKQGVNLPERIVALMKSIHRAVCQKQHSADISDWLVAEAQFLLEMSDENNIQKICATPSFQHFNQVFNQLCRATVLSQEGHDSLFQELAAFWSLYNTELESIPERLVRLMEQHCGGEAIDLLELLQVIVEGKNDINGLELEKTAVKQKNILNSKREPGTYKLHMRCACEVYNRNIAKGYKGTGPGSALTDLMDNCLYLNMPKKSTQKNSQTENNVETKEGLVKHAYRMLVCQLKAAAGYEKDRFLDVEGYKCPCLNTSLDAYCIKHPMGTEKKP